jgi:hypothetical protein
MPTIVQKESRCTIEVSGAAVRAIFIAQHKRNAGTVHKSSYVPEVPIGDCLFTGRNQRDKQFAGCLARQTIASSLQGRGSVRRAQTTDKTSPSAIAKIVERGGAIPPRGHRQNLKRLVRQLDQRRSQELGTT